MSRKQVALELVLIGAAALVVLAAALGAASWLAKRVPWTNRPSCPDCFPLEGLDRAPTCPSKTILSARQRLEALRAEAGSPGESPVVDLPEELRQKNYWGGSCVHASLITLMRWNGLDEMADWWRQNHGHGEYAQRLNGKMERAGLKYAYTVDGDVAFLEWCIRTRRGAGIGYYPSHAINIVDLTASEAILLDNNRTHTYIRVPRSEFERNWKHRYGGWAYTIVYDPPPPRPWRAGGKTVRVESSR